MSLVYRCPNGKEIEIGRFSKHLEVISNGKPYLVLSEYKNKIEGTEIVGNIQRILVPVSEIGKFKEGEISVCLCAERNLYEPLRSEILEEIAKNAAILKDCILPKKNAKM